MAKSILVVDDEPEIRNILQEILETEGWIVDTAGDGDTAVALLEQKHHALIICDISMPGMTGFQTISRIRDRGLMCAIIMLSAHVEKEKIIESFRLGAIDYITKPFDPEGLLKKVATLYEVGRRIKSLSSDIDSVNPIESLQKQLKYIEQFRTTNQRRA